MDNIVLKRDAMSLSGSSLFDEIQNKHTPLLDLLVRESIQNSLDADDAERVGREFVKMDFDIGTFNSESLASFLPELNGALGQSDDCEYLSISDYNTKGLNGSLDEEGFFSEDNNYRKLVCEIRNGQTKEGAGGSWGIGKTIFYKVGKGLVAYYSRIEASPSVYEERLAVILVEDEKGDCLLKNVENYRGIAFWGRNGEWKYRDKYILPITDPLQIKTFLDVFGLSRYSGDETGTRIIIPFINQSKLIKDAKGDLPYTSFPASLSEYLELAIQRWYAPRLANRNYKDITGSCYLKVDVDGYPVEPDRPLFDLIRRLYSSCVSDTDDVNGIKVEKIRLQKLGMKVAGWLCYKKVSKRELMILPPDNMPDPYYEIGRVFDPGDGGNEPVFAFLRKPGMIVDYRAEGSWLKRVPRTSADEYLIAVFVVNSSQELLHFEEYLRSLECADHFDWKDSEGSIVSNLKQNIARKLKAFLEQKDEKKEKEMNKGLSKLFASKFLPPQGFSVWDQINGNQSSGGFGDEGRPARTRKGGVGYVKLQPLGSPIFEGEFIYFPLSMTLPERGAYALDLEILSDGGSIPIERWESEIGRKADLSLVDFMLNQVKQSKSSKRDKEPDVFPLLSTMVRNTIVGYDLHFEYEKTRRGTLYRLMITSGYDKCELMGLVCYSARNLEGVLELEKEEG